METDLPEKIRTFVAIFPSVEIATRLEELQRSLRKEIFSEAIRWTKPEHIHLTLNFLGDIHSARLTQFQLPLSEVCGKARTFSLDCAGLGFFPDARRPKVFWAGLAGETERLGKLKSSFDEALVAIGVPREERAFHPHLTLGRVKDLNGQQRKRIREVMSGIESNSFGSWRVERIDFMRSVLSSDGSQYEVLKSFPLSDGNR